jgi:hypothetical protein
MNIVDFEYGKKLMGNFLARPSRVGPQIHELLFEIRNNRDEGHPVCNRGRFGVHWCKRRRPHQGYSSSR